MFSYFACKLKLGIYPIRKKTGVFSLRIKKNELLNHLKDGSCSLVVPPMCFPFNVDKSLPLNLIMKSCAL